MVSGQLHTSLSFGNHGYILNQVTKNKNFNLVKTKKIIFKWLGLKESVLRPGKDVLKKVFCLLPC